MRFAAFSLVVLSSLSATAGETDLEKYFTIQSMQVREVPTEDVQSFATPVAPSSIPLPDTLLGEIDLGEIINTAKAIWTVIEANRPVTNHTSDVANALPVGAGAWNSLEGWQAPRSKTYRVTYQNGFGVNVVDFTYRVIYTFGGSVNGRGRYLTHVTIVPAELSVSWGYKFNAQATVPSVTNAGTKADPLAAMMLQMHWSVDTVLRHSENTENYYVRGDGHFRDVSVNP